ncbi:MAG: SDR family oxidoreductase [Acidimicrobiales bacterium]
MVDNKIALITGANKGIGFEIARQVGLLGYTVLVGARDGARGAQAASELCAHQIDATAVALDVTNGTTITAAAKEIDGRYGRLDVLVNNAGISGGAATTPSEVPVGLMREVYETNVFGVVAVTNGMLPLLLRTPAARIVNMSSGLGSLSLSSDPESDFGGLNYLAYQSSKAALNAVTIAYAKEFRDTAVKVNAADPGFTATDFNNHRGHRSVEQAAVVAVRLACLDDGGPTGTFQDEDGIVPW